MSIEEKIRQIMSSKELSDSEKLDQLHALIPPETFKIDSTITATPERMRQSTDALAVTDAMQEIRRADFLAKEADQRTANPPKPSKKAPPGTK